MSSCVLSDSSVINPAVITKPVSSTAGREEHSRSRRIPAYLRNQRVIGWKGAEKTSVFLSFKYTGWNTPERDQEFCFYLVFVLKGLSTACFVPCICPRLRRSPWFLPMVLVPRPAPLSLAHDLPHLPEMLTCAWPACSEPATPLLTGLQCPREPGAGVQERRGLVWRSRQAGPQLGDGPRHPNDQQASGAKGSIPEGMEAALWGAGASLNRGHRRERVCLKVAGSGLSRQRTTDVPTRQACGLLHVPGGSPHLQLSPVWRCISPGPAGQRKS